MDIANTTERRREEENTSNTEPFVLHKTTLLNFSIMRGKGKYGFCCGWLYYTPSSHQKNGQAKKIRQWNLENKCASINRAEAPHAESMLEEIRQAKQFLLHP